MGLTINYSLTAKGKPIILLEKLRQKALDLPFEHVGNLVHLAPDACAKGTEYWRNRDRETFDLLLDCGTSIRLPWMKMRTGFHHVDPIEAYVFLTNPGPGCESATFGLVRFPAVAELNYRPEDDDRFTTEHHERGSTWWTFNYRSWKRHCDRTGKNGWDYNKVEKRTVRTGLGSQWTFGSFCKTQYASDPECGGVANFIRCHLAVIRVLEYAREIGIEVNIDDEGHFAEAHYSDDYREAYAAGRKPTYVDHPATHSIKALLEQLGDYNQLVAGFAGMLKEAAGAHGMNMVAPITNFQNYEHLEADFHVKQGKEFDQVIKAFGELAKK